MIQKAKAEKLYKSVNTFVLTCVGTDGYPLTKAVLPGKHRESLEELYFCTNTSSKFVVEISKNSKASVYFYSRKLAWKGCLLKGDMEIVTDMSVKEKYWQNKFKNAYHKNPSPTPIFACLNSFPIPVDFIRGTSLRILKFKVKSVKRNLGREVK